MVDNTNNNSQDKEEATREVAEVVREVENLEWAEVALVCNNLWAWEVCKDNPECHIKEDR